MTHVRDKAPIVVHHLLVSAKIPKGGGSGAIGATESVHREQPAADALPALIVPIAPSSDTNTLAGPRRDARSQTSGLHVRMRSMLGKVLDFGAQIDRSLANLVAAVDQTLTEIAQVLVLQPQLAFVSLDGARARNVAPTESVKGPTVLNMASIRDMLAGAGRLLNEVPAQWRDAEFSEVVAAAKKNEPGAKKAKKIAQNKRRLAEKTKGKQ